MSMYFLDETDDWPEYKVIRDEINQLDRTLIELQKQLQDAETELRSAPENDEVKSRIGVLMILPARMRSFSAGIVFPGRSLS